MIDQAHYPSAHAATRKRPWHEVLTYEAAQWNPRTERGQKRRDVIDHLHELGPHAAHWWAEGFRADHVVGFQESLLGDAPVPVAPGPPEETEQERRVKADRKKAADRREWERRTWERKREQLEAGIHPGTGRRVRLRVVGTDVTTNRTCGDCAYLIRHRPGGKTFFKCGHPEAPPPSHGPATDIRKGWPACVLFLEAQAQEAAQ